MKILFCWAEPPAVGAGWDQEAMVVMFLQALKELVQMIKVYVLDVGFHVSRTWEKAVNKTLHNICVYI